MRTILSVVIGLVLLATPLAAEESVKSREARSNRAALAMLQHWNEIAVDASGRDHGPPGPAEQLGPVRAARAMAIVHIAVFDTVNAFDSRYQSYTRFEAAPDHTSMSAAIASAAHATLVAMFPSQAALHDAVFLEDLAEIGESNASLRGVRLGRRVAARILALRANDGSHHAEPVVGVGYLPGDRPGEWRVDPISLIPLALGAHWSRVAPFVIPSAKRFRTPPPPAITSRAYADAYLEVQQLGEEASPVRTFDQTHAGIYWAYDGTPSLCAPPRLYNQIATQIARERGATVVELARLLALLHVAMADAGLAAWESKYAYRYWRPVTAIREADAGTGPTGLGDDNPATQGDPAWRPLGAPASNLSGPNFTPPFPAYPSGHAVFGGALFQVLRRFYRTDQIPFTFVSDEFNGITRDNTGQIRPLLPRTFQTLSEAEEENGQSRIYLGIHFSFDKTDGIAQGRRVADYVFTHAFRPAQ